MYDPVSNGYIFSDALQTSLLKSRKMHLSSKKEYLVAFGRCLAYSVNLQRLRRIFRFSIN